MQGSGSPASNDLSWNIRVSIIIVLEVFYSTFPRSRHELGWGKDDKPP
jgi:hypothetical protein